MTVSGAPTTAVLVHGLWHGSWAWDAVRDLLADRGVDSVAPELPLTSITADVAAVDAVLDVVPGPAVLVGHSYGGAVITAAGDAANVAALVYLAGFALDESESISRTAPAAAVPPTRLGEALRFSEDGTQVFLDPVLGREVLYSGTPAAIADDALSRLRPVARGLFSARPPVVAWRMRRSVFAICAADRCVAPALQRVMAARLDEQVEWDSDHSPPASHPDLVADLVARVVAEVAAAGSGDGPADGPA